MSRQFGKVLGVTERPAGGFLITAAVPTDTVLELDDTSQFGEEPGGALLRDDDGNEELVDIESIDPEAETATLVAGIAGSFAIGTALLCYPEILTRYAEVAIVGAEDDTITALVPSQVARYLSLGTRLDEDRERVTLEFEDETDNWVVRDVYVDDPEDNPIEVFYGDIADPPTIPEFLDDLADVDAPAPDDGDVLTWIDESPDGFWAPMPPSGGPGSATIIVKEGGSVVDPNVDTLDFDGTAFAVVESPEDEANIGLSFGTGAGQPAEGDHTHGVASGHTIKEAGTPLTDRAGLNFGSGFDLADDAGNNETDVELDLTELSAFTDHSARHENAGADEISLAGLDGTPVELQNHLDDTADAHDASAVSIADAGNDFTATTVEGALDELQADNEAHAAAGDPHPQYRLESDDLQSITFAKTGVLTTGTGTMRWYNDTGRTLTLVSARGSVDTQPTGASILVDVNNNGTSVWNSNQSNRITIAASTNTDEGGAFDDSSIADGEYITVDIDQVGSTIAGSDLTVTIWYTS